MGEPTPQIVTETVSDVVTAPNGQRIGITDTGRRVPVSRRTQRGHKVKVYGPAPQMGGRGGGDDVPEAEFLSASQDLGLGIGITALGNAFAIDVEPNTPKLLGRLTLDALANTPGGLTLAKVGGQSVFASARNVSGVATQFPLAAFASGNPGTAHANNANLIAPAAIGVELGGAFLAAAQDRLLGTYETNLIPASRYSAYESVNRRSGQTNMAIGDVNWLFACTPAIALGAGNSTTLTGRAARQVVLGQLVLQASDDAAGTLIPFARGISVSEIRVSGRPLESGGAAMSAAPFSFDSAAARLSFLGKSLPGSQELEIDVTNNTAGAVSVLAGCFLVR